MKTIQDEEEKEDDENAKSEGHISITDDQQFILIREDIANLREELLAMINSNKNKTYDCEKKIKFIDDWKAFLVKDLNLMKKKLKTLYKKHEDEEKGFNDSIMNVQTEREEMI